MVVGENIINDRGMKSFTINLYAFVPGYRLHLLIRVKKNRIILNLDLG